ncbi:hypothetical protein F5Y16DRAFT_98996 [Xylariaceae sp. FL0255]|nr:hypothetical protein F5Y16DRAFT_98996 [Xylariaceae sp. FL0255]
MAISYLLWPSAAICFTIITFITLKKPQRDIVFGRLGLAPDRNRPSTPTLEKQPLSKPLAESSSELASALPPSQRDQLKELAPKLSPIQKKALGDLSFDQKVYETSLLGLQEDFRAANGSKYSYSGFSVAEIKALGDFPDYSLLSEVPMPNPYHEFDIDKAKARPYRPFRWGYHQTMSLTKLEPDWWIELESTYKTRIAQRKAFYEKHGKDVLQWLPGSELACKELMEMVLQFLCARYPQYFSLYSKRRKGYIFTNKILNTETVIGEQHPLLVLLDHVPEDFAITLRDPVTGYYSFRAGIICSALGWNVDTKIGKELHEIHEVVPDYKEKMQFSMDRYFSKMPVNKPIQRGSWGVEVDEPLYMPPGDPHEAYRSYQDASLTIQRINLRVDWQTLRRLPLSGAIVFNFKALFTPLEEFRTEPYVPSLVLKVLEEGKENLMKYKNTWHTHHVAFPALREYIKEQEDKGLIEKDWDVATLAKSPFFPGWEEKWHAQQGF